MKHQTCLVASLLGLAALATFPASAQLPLEDGDTACIIGNGLADRMQHDGWVENLIQSELADKNISFRNLAFTGDTVTSRPRSKGFTTPEDYLTHCKADVVSVFFGYNESFAGEAGLTKFKANLGAMIEKYRAVKFNAESAPRFVLFSPIAHENLKTPLLPEGHANKINLDPKIWAIAQGKDFKVDDSNIPPPVEMISNVGGGSKSSSAAKEGSDECLDGKEAISKMHVPEGFAVTPTFAIRHVLRLGSLELRCF